MGHDEDSCGKLLSQLRKYKMKRAPFNLPYNPKSDNPVIWWETAQDAEDNLELQTLALRLFAITPHSASCERSFSILGWFYGQRRTRLATDQAEGMCKMHTYYITDAKHELPYYAVNISEDQLHAQMINSIMEIGDESEEVTEADFDIFNGENVVNPEIDITRVYSLDITREVNFENQIFDLERQYEDDQASTSQRMQAVVLAPQHDDFDIETLVRGINEL